MDNKTFIEFVAGVAVADWKERKIMLPSVVIAQAILESGWGKSELATLSSICSDLLYTQALSEMG